MGILKYSALGLRFEMFVVGHCHSIISILVAILVLIQPIIAEIFWGDEYFLRHSDDCLFKIDGADVKTVGNHNLTANSSFNCGDLCYKDQYCTHFNWFPKVFSFKFRHF